MNKDEKERLQQAFMCMHIADKSLTKAAALLGKFGMNVPLLNGKGLKIMAETTNSIEFSNAFVRSFIRVSTLRQIVPQETKGST